MKLRASLQLIAALALLAGLTIPAAAQAGSAKNPSHHGKPGAGKKCSGKKNSGKKKSGNKCSGKQGSGKKVGATESTCGGQDCYVDFQVMQASPTTGGFCDSFDRGDGMCVGPSAGTPGWTVPSYAPRYGLQTSFTWESHGGAERDVDYTAKSAFTISQAYIRGNVPSSGSAIFNVTDAWNRGTDAHWKTVAKGGAPGTRGGPLYIDYEHRVIGSYIHIWGYMVPASSAAASTSAAKPRSYECQHPVVTGQEAVNPKGVTPKEACKVVRSLGKFLSKRANVKKLYECRGETPRRPGRPVLLMDEFEGWKLKLVNGYSFVMHKPGASLRVTGTDFPVNCS